MPKPDGTLYGFERTEIFNAQRRYYRAVDELKMHGKDPRSYPRLEAAERKAFADLLCVQTKYAGCK